MKWSTIKPKLIIRGAVSFTPLYPLFRRKCPIKQSRSARYSYSVWLRHLVLATRKGNLTFPCTIAELGPGDTLGSGIAAILSGANEYYAFEEVNYTDICANLKIFEELLELFMCREPIPGVDEFPLVSPIHIMEDSSHGDIPDPSSYAFPSHILTDELLGKSLSPDRVEAVRESIRNLFNPDFRGPVTIRYAYNEDSGIKSLDESIDFVFSQAVLEHVNHPDDLYRIMMRSLLPGGLMSHQIDYKSHNTARHWNGHWTYPEWLWTLLRGKYPYLINRNSHSEHLGFHSANNANVIHMELKHQSSIISQKQLVKRFRNRPLEDLTISGAYILSCKNSV